ncbi:unnamed protein product [Mytilus edulis]|uniref:Uncharacterized protein n=1 Tax=Mytilus edulis TaxID=6550 RepID=A0A8S3UYU0_MYTED|nr:unnamed protein product [Mytilus edulis]
MTESALNSAAAMDIANPENEELNKSYNGSSEKCQLGIGQQENFDQFNTGITTVHSLPLESHKILVQNENIMAVSSTVNKEPIKIDSLKNNRMSNGKFNSFEGGHLRSHLNPSCGKIHKKKSNKENVNNVNISPLAELKPVLKKEDHINDNKNFPTQPVKAKQVMHQEKSITELINALYGKREGDPIDKEGKPKVSISFSKKVKEDIVDKRM